jgi:hypothetical protein
VETHLSRTKNPFFEHAEAEYFIAERDGDVVGRIAAISNRLHNETHEDRVGFFGFFESIDDQDVANALLEAAAGWCRALGHDVLRGPTSFSVNDECGLLVDGFDTPPALMMPHNPPYYIGLLERGGLVKAKDLWVYQGGSEQGYVPVPERLARATEMIRQRQGITLRSLGKELGLRSHDRARDRPPGRAVQAGGHPRDGAHGGEGRQADRLRYRPPRPQCDFPDQPVGPTVPDDSSAPLGTQDETDPASSHPPAGSGAGLPGEGR